MSEGITLDLGSAAPYIVESVLSLLGKDAESREWKVKVAELVKLSAAQASMVQCVGMSQPIPITDIYQRTTIVIPSTGGKLELESLQASKKDAIIFAGPGWGKTTFLHWFYVKLCTSKGYVPLLFTLRWPNAIEDLEAVVRQLQHGRDVARKKGTSLVLLVDGYDEITEPERQRVSKALMLFASLSIGNFFLTCRAHYLVYDLKCWHLELGPFDLQDARKFVAAYSRAYGSELDGDALLKELEDHRLEEFYQHPLMLTLVCILKSGPSRQIPRRSIGLLRRAIDTLTFRWDESKSVHRQSTIPLDGEERVRCLMRIAFDMNELQASWETIHKSATEHLSLLQMKGVNVRNLLEEMARFYGILVPAGADYWEFAHRTFHDYLSARYWVESGKFDPNEVHQWDLHAAYAACLTADATNSMLLMLSHETEIAPFIECLYNTAPFQAQPVAQGLIIRAARSSPSERFGGLKPIRMVEKGTSLSVQTGEDFYSFCSDEFLRAILMQTAIADNWSDKHTDPTRFGAKVVSVCAIGELLQRGARIRQNSFLLFKNSLRESKASDFSCLIGDRQFSFTLNDLASVCGLKY
jgi:hypothetical protein